MLALWKNSYLEGLNGFTCEYNYNLTTGACRAYCDWQVGTWIDDSVFGGDDAGVWPKMFYFSNTVDPTTYYWNATLQITG